MKSVPPRHDSRPEHRQTRLLAAADLKRRSAKSAQAPNSGPNHSIPRLIDTVFVGVQLGRNWRHWGDEDTCRLALARCPSVQSQILSPEFSM